jgi:hypothetical protein
VSWRQKVLKLKLNTGISEHYMEHSLGYTNPKFVKYSPDMSETQRSAPAKKTTIQ